MIRLTMLCSAATEANRRGAFPADEPLDERAAAEAEAMRVKRPERALSSPALRARQTAERLGLDAAVEPALRDIDYGAWAGKALTEIAPSALAEWRADPAAAPHGGETLAALFERTRGFLEGLGDGRTTAVTHAAVMRAAVALALDAPMLSFWRIDIEPLARITLHGEGGRWRLRSIPG